MRLPKRLREHQVNFPNQTGLEQSTLHVLSHGERFEPRVLRSVGNRHGKIDRAVNHLELAQEAKQNCGHQMETLSGRWECIRWREAIRTGRLAAARRTRDDSQLTERKLDARVFDRDLACRSPRVA